MNTIKSMNSYQTKNEVSVRHKWSSYNLTRKIHQKNGKVHLHGLRSKPCLGSNELPLPDHQTALSRTIPSTTQPDQYHQSGGTDSSFSQGTHSEAKTPVSNEDQPLTTSFPAYINHPSLQAKLLRHIPKGARTCTGQLLTNIINRLLKDPTRPEHWG